MTEQNYTPFIIRDIILETADTKTFVIKRVDNEHVDYLSGQFITLVFHSISGAHRRSYSLTSAPCCDNELAFTVKKIINGNFSRYLVDKAQIGDMLWSTGISGFFTLPEDMHLYRQLFFVAAGSGITPIFSLIKSALHQFPHIKINLLYSAKNPKGTIFYHQLEQLKEQYKSRFEIHYFFSASTDLLQARLNNTLLTKLLHQYKKSNLKNVLFFVCGPYAYMDTVIIALLTEGVPKENIRKENFSSFKPEVERTPPDEKAHKVTINYNNGKKKTIQVQYPQTILDTALKHNIPLPYSCLSGQCGSCTAKIFSGNVWMSYNEVLTEKELSIGLTLTCTGYPIEGDVELTI